MAEETNAWRRLASYEVTSSTGNQRYLTVSGMAKHSNLKVVIMCKRSSTSTAIRNDIVFDDVNSGSKYCRRRKVTGSSSGSTNENAIDVRGDETNDRYIVLNILNWDGEEKICWGEMIVSNSNASGTVTSLRFGAKYTNKTGQIQKISCDSGTSGGYGVGSFITVFASTPDGTEDEKTTLTNVPENTRYEEVDTRKIYRSKSVGFADGTSGSGSDWTEVAFDSSTSVNNATASGNVVSRSSGSGWDSYIRSTTHYLDPSEGGGEVYFTASNTTHVSCGLEKSPHNQYPSATYTNANYSFHTTIATNNIYEKTTAYDGTDWNNATNEWRITMDSAGLVKYYYRVNSSGSWNLERTSTVTASGKYYVTASPNGNTIECACFIKSSSAIAWKERGVA